MMARWILAALVAIMLGGCDLFDDDDSSDASPQPPPEEEPAPNTRDIETNLTAGQVIDGGQMGASGTADLTLNLDDNLLSGTVVLEGVSADSVVLNTGYAGESGSQFATLDQQGGDWTLPETELSAQERERLMAGGFHIVATSADDRVLRGQILVGTVELLLTRLSGMQVVPPVDTMATGRGFLTVDTSSGDIVVNLRLQGLDDATQAHIHRALAGVNGGVIEDLVQGDAGPGHWTSEQEATLAAEELEALNAGALYYQVHTPEWPGGEVRGQLEPAGVEIDFTLLAGEDVVIPGMSGVDTDASATAATTLVTNDGLLEIHLNTRNLGDATGASLNVAPEGQNGPVRVTLEQEEGNASYWFAEGVMLDDEDRENLRNQAFYFTVTSPEWPDGEIRGQWRPEGSSPGGDDETFQVVAVEPDNGAELEQFPAQIQVTFNREPDGGTANPDSVELTASGGDGSFNDGNEEAMTPLVINTSEETLTIDTAGLDPGDDVYQLRLSGGPDALTDTFGNALDGDADATAGGDFVATFSVMGEDMDSDATFTFIQENVFTPNCTFSGCHSGGSPAAGQNLTEGEAFDNIVGVPSTQVPELLRVDPGNPDDSYLVRKVEGTASVGERMPLGMAPLSAETIQTLREWISEGAQNN